MQLKYFLFFILFSFSSFIKAQDKKNALRTDPVLGVIQGNTTAGYERYFSPSFSTVLTFHYLNQRKSTFASLPDGSYTTNTYQSKGFRFSLEFRNYFSLVSEQKKSFFFSPTLFTGQHQIDYNIEIRSRNGDFFQENGKATTTVNASGLAFYIGNEWKGNFGEFIEIAIGGGYRYTSNPWRSITYKRWDQSIRSDEFRLRNDVNGFFSRVSLVLGLEF